MPTDGPKRMRDSASSTVGRTQVHTFLRSTRLSGRQTVNCSVSARVLLRPITALSSSMITVGKASRSLIFQTKSVWKFQTETLPNFCEPAVVDKTGCLRQRPINQSARLVLSVEQPARLVIRARRVDLRRILGRLAAIVVIISLLRIGLRVVHASVAAARRRIARNVWIAVGRIDVTIVRPLLRILILAGRRLLRRQHHRFAGGVILLRVGVGRVAARDGGIGSPPRIARRDPAD